MVVPDEGGGRGREPCAAFAHSLRQFAIQSKKVKVSEVIKKVEADGWVLIRASGSHRHFKHPTKRGIVTISGNTYDEMPKGTLGNVLRQAGLK